MSLALDHLAQSPTLSYCPDMLSVLIETRNDEEGLARTLASLVSGAVEGVIRDVIVCDQGSLDQTHGVAEHAGCRFVRSGGIAAGIKEAKGDWILWIEPGARLGEGWIEAALEHMATSTAAARFSRSGEAGSSFLGRLFRRDPPLSCGLLLTKRQAAELTCRACDARAVARGLSAKPLEGKISVAPPKKRER